MASKIRETDIKIKYIVHSYYKLKKKYDINEIPNELTEEKQIKIKEKICIAEGDIIKLIGYNFNIIMPFDYLDILVRKYYRNKGIFFIKKIRNN